MCQFYSPNNSFNVSSTRISPYTGSVLLHTNRLKSNLPSFHASYLPGPSMSRCTLSGCALNHFPRHLLQLSCQIPSQRGSWHIVHCGDRSMFHRWYGMRPVHGDTLGTGGRVQVCVPYPAFHNVTISDIVCPCRLHDNYIS